MKEKLCKKVVEVLRKSDRVMVFEEEVIRVTCVYAPQEGRSECEKDQFDNKMADDFIINGRIYKTLVK